MPHAPEITPAPRAHELHRAIKRQDDSSESQTCGYISGVLESSITCGFGEACAHNDGGSVFGCCTTPVVDELDCVIQTACVDYSDISQQDDPELTLYCIQSGLGMCQKYTDTDNYSQWVCGLSHGTFSMAFSAGDMGVTLGSMEKSAGTRSAGTRSGDASPVLTLASTANAATGAAAAGAAFPTFTSTSNSVSNSNSTSSNDRGTTGNGLSTGTIVGIAVGVAVIVTAGLATAVFFLWRHRKNKQNGDKGFLGTSSPSGSQGQNHAQPLMASSGHIQPSYQVTDVSPVAPDDPDQHLVGQWDGIRPGVAQKQSATKLHHSYGYGYDDDGLGNKPELRPEDAAGEPQYYDSRTSQIYSEAGRTALYPASESIWPQRA